LYKILRILKIYTNFWNCNWINDNGKAFPASWAKSGPRPTTNLASASPRSAVHCACHVNGHRAPGIHSGTSDGGEPVDAVWQDWWLRHEYTNGSASSTEVKAGAHRCVSTPTTWWRKGGPMTFIVCEVSTMVAGGWGVSL
jgi:hypothetical protein